MAAAGLETMTPHWHIRTLERSTWIVALDATTALRHVLRVQETGSKRRVRAAVLSVAIRLGLVGALAREGSVIGRRPPSGAGR